MRKRDEEEKSTLSAQEERGWWKLGTAYACEDMEGEISDVKTDFPDVYEQVHQMDGQAQRFKNNQPSIVPGEMGVHDMKILMAIYESARADGKRVTLSRTTAWACMGQWEKLYMLNSLLIVSELMP